MNLKNLSTTEIRQLVVLIKTLHPNAGLVADLAFMVLTATLPSNKSEEIRLLISWLEGRILKLLEQLANKNNSDELIRELEIRLHETLDILIDMKQEKPWYE